jgi:hypothetical protein
VSLPPFASRPDDGAGSAIEHDPMTALSGRTVPLRVTPAQYAAMLRAEQDPKTNELEKNCHE